MFIILYETNKSALLFKNGPEQVVISSSFKPTLVLALVVILSQNQDRIKPARVTSIHFILAVEPWYSSSANAMCSPVSTPLSSPPSSEHSTASGARMSSSPMESHGQDEVTEDSQTHDFCTQVFEHFHVRDASSLGSSARPRARKTPSPPLTIILGEAPRKDEMEASRYGGDPKESLLSTYTERPHGDRRGDGAAAPTPLAGDSDGGRNTIWLVSKRGIKGIK